jgi:hypothetical protein
MTSVYVCMEEYVTFTWKRHRIQWRWLLVNSSQVSMSDYHRDIFFLVCHNMGMCCMKLAELDAAEKSFTEALNMWTALFPRGHDQILISKTRSIKGTVQHDQYIFVYVQLDSCYVRSGK